MTRARKSLLVVGIILLLALLGWILALIIAPAFQNTIVMTAGVDNGIYRGFADKYAAVLKRQGINLEIHSSSGAVENYERLKDPGSKYDVGFIQSGTTHPQPSDHLETIAVVSYEPIWVFYRGSTDLTRLADLRGKTIAVGVPGSGLNNVAMALLSFSDVTRENSTLLEMDAVRSYDALASKKVDAGFFIGRPDAVIQQKLLNSDLKLMSFSQADALVQKFPSLSKIIYPRGSTSIVKDLPRTDVTLLAATALLVAKDALHPAMVYVLLEAAKQVHGGEDYFTPIGAFPNLKTDEFPVSGESERYFKSGQPFLLHYLPFWLASFIERRLLILLPFMAVLFGLIQALPRFYEAQVKKRLVVWYRDLKALDDELWTTRSPTSEQIARWRDEIEYIDAQASRIRMPRKYIQDVYLLKQAIGVVRARIGKLTEPL
ncbi:TAXI family TRAP transporter solute-binding subunit [Pararobbsia alpina]|uniref:TAXI family TRAP transporter solute-binding subunit n=1 Tax=Pararobbsia alpina TaxID=621374 RepID=UPI0039A5703C